VGDVAAHWRSAFGDMVALRDSEPCGCSDAFDMLLTRYPRVMLNLLKIVVRRRAKPHAAVSGSAPKPRINPAPAWTGEEPVARHRQALVKMGAKAAVVDSALKKYGMVQPSRPKTTSSPITAMIPQHLTNFCCARPTVYCDRSCGWRCIP
jgi:hypothetical protein